MQVKQHSSGTALIRDVARNHQVFLLIYAKVSRVDRCDRVVRTADNARNILELAGTPYLRHQAE